MENSVRPVRIGLISASRIAPGAIVKPAEARAGVRIVAVAARDLERAKAFAFQHAIPDVAADYDALAARDDIDLIYVATPAALHAGPVITALKAGKAVLCEKPLAASLGDVQAMVSAGQKAGRPLLEAMHYRFHNAMFHVLNLVETGALGRLHKIEARFHAPIVYRPEEPRWNKDLGGGALLDLGCYAVHAARTIAAAEPVVVQARQGVSHGVDAWTSALLQFPDGLQALIDCSMAPEQRDRTLKIYGDLASLEVTNFVNPQAGCSIVLVGRGGRTIITPTGPTSFEAQLDHVVRVLGGREEPRTGGTDAIGNACVLADIQAAAIRAPI